jgi:hypothetical protein
MSQFSLPLKPKQMDEQKKSERRKAFKIVSGVGNWRRMFANMGEMDGGKLDEGGKAAVVYGPNGQQPPCCICIFYSQFPLSKSL